MSRFCCLNVFGSTQTVFGRAEEFLVGRDCFEKPRFTRVLLLRVFAHAGELLWQRLNPVMRKRSSEDLVKRLECS